MTNDEKSTIEKFDGLDFSLLRISIEDYLYIKGLHQPLSSIDIVQSEWELLDRKALGVVQRSLAHNAAFDVSEKMTMKLLKALLNMYEKLSVMNKVQFMQKLFNQKMSGSSRIVDHIHEFNGVLVQLSLVDISFDNKIKALTLLSSLVQNGYHGE